MMCIYILRKAIIGQPHIIDTHTHTQQQQQQQQQNVYPNIPISFGLAT